MSNNRSKSKKSRTQKSASQVAPAKLSDLELEDFVIERVDQDLVFMSNAMQLILGPWGYQYCLANSARLEREYQKDKFFSFVKNDELKLYQLDLKAQSFKSVRPYGGRAPDEQNDLLSLSEQGFICKTGRQVELFHAYLMENLMRRFNQYLYLPSKKIARERAIFGPFAHRGYDFLLAITLYLELQLGVHIYIGENNPKHNIEEFKNQVTELFKLPPEIPLTNGMLLFLMDYFQALSEGLYLYDLNTDIECYRSAELYTESQYKEYKKMLIPDFYPEPAQCNYLLYLQHIISATCFNYPGMYAAALYSFPQSDFAKYLCGLEYAIELFEDKITTKKICIPNEMLEKLPEVTDHIPEHTTFDVTREKHYQDTVFFLMDELNGMWYHIRPQDLSYRDIADINDDDFTINGDSFDVNPARKSTNTKPVRKLKMELYSFLNGKCFQLEMGAAPGELDSPLVNFLKYPILPWISSGTEDTVHIDCAPTVKLKPEMIFSRSLLHRQQYLHMEYQLTVIPVNCLEEYLNPDIFFNWKSRNDLLLETQRQNIELKRHIKLNQELVRSLSHSSANFLNSDRLVKTGLSLHHADRCSPTLDTLHSKGLELLLHAEQESYLTRQLDSLVLRCSADVDELTQQIRAGLSRERGCVIDSPICFALKSIMARILFNDDDLRSKFIRSKLFSEEGELIAAESSFMLDVLAVNSTNKDAMLNWWNTHVNVLHITRSDVWNKLHIVEKGAFYDLVTEVISELIFNALSHGNMNEIISLEFGQDEGHRGRPSWVYICCHNACGEEYKNGKQKGISTLKETVSLVNSQKRSIDISIDGQEYNIKIWLLASLLRPSADQGGTYEHSKKNSLD